jgi:hypothetical protein
MKTARQIVEASKAKISSLENKLAGTLKPVAPRREFVHGLGSHIKTNTPPTIVSRLASIHSTLILIAGLLSVSVLVAVGVRALLTLLGKKTLSRV